jgi:hypothetical protein
MNFLKLLTLSQLLWVFCLICNQAISQPVTWDASTSYSRGALVIVGTSTYIATQSVPEEYYLLN